MACRDNPKVVKNGTKKLPKYLKATKAATKQREQSAARARTLPVEAAGGGSECAGASGQSDLSRERSGG